MGESFLAVSMRRLVWEQNSHRGFIATVSLQLMPNESNNNLQQRSSSLKTFYQCSDCWGQTLICQFVFYRSICFEKQMSLLGDNCNIPVQYFIDPPTGIWSVSRWWSPKFSGAGAGRFSKASTSSTQGLLQSSTETSSVTTSSSLVLQALSK